jgi:ribosomal protein S18 acetylase RimI-like enzyme
MSTLPLPRFYNPTTDSALLDPIARLHATCILQDNLLATFLPPLSHDKILASWKAWSEQVVAGNRVIVLQLSDSGELAGVVSLGFPDTETGKHRSEVGRLIVSPDFRKRGLARRMMEVLEVVARERGRWMMVSCFIFYVFHVFIAWLVYTWGTCQTD